MTDDDLLKRISALYTRRDPMPRSVLADATRALPLGAVDFAWLERLDDAPGVRGATPLLSFGDGALVVDVELFRERACTGVRGLVTPVTAAARVDVCWPSGQLTAGVDEVGRFDAVGLPQGPLRLVVRCPGAPTVATRWFVA